MSEDERRPSAGPQVEAVSGESIAKIIDPVAFDPISMSDTHPSWQCRRDTAMETANKILALGHPDGHGFKTNGEPSMLQALAERLERLNPDRMIGEKGTTFLYSEDISAIVHGLRLVAANPQPQQADARGAVIEEATQAQHFDLLKGEPAQFVRNGELKTCQCNDCRALSASPATDAAAPVQGDGRLLEQLISQPPVGDHSPQR